MFMRLLLFIISGLFMLSCIGTNSRNDIADKKNSFNQTLADELRHMAAIDQIAAYIPQGKYKEWSAERWNGFKDSVFTTHKVRLEEILDEFGYPGYNLVGKEGETHYWLMVQHCDYDPDFQLKVLGELKTEVENKNADPSNFALLTDRVKINTPGKQIYGTQVTYNSYGQAYPKALADSVNVNKRREEVGLEPLEDYLNTMTLMHFEMNKENLKQRGITAPKLYQTNVTGKIKQ